jgi:hypothetical protein
VECAFGILSSDRLMSVLTLQWSLLRPVLFCTIFVCDRNGYKFEDALTVTGLDMPDGQLVRGGLTANSVRKTVADYFITDAGAASCQMSKI